MSTHSLHFDNRFLRELPGDSEAGSRRREVQGAAWSQVMPTPVAAPQLLACSAEVLALLGFDTAEVGSQAFAEVFAGNALYEGMQPWAANYGGHQFGNWAGQLGDGRAISLGELVADGRRWELQLKGAGATPYSRGADGRAVLRSSVREFLCSEAMHHLGVPTTRALSLVATGEPVVRDMFYDGHPRLSRGRWSAGWRRRSSVSGRSSCRPRVAIRHCCGNWPISALPVIFPSWAAPVSRVTRIGSCRCARAPR